MEETPLPPPPAKHPISITTKRSISLVRPATGEALENPAAIKISTDADSVQTEEKQETPDGNDRTLTVQSSTGRRPLNIKLRANPGVLRIPMLPPEEMEDSTAPVLKIGLPTEVLRIPMPEAATAGNDAVVDETPITYPDFVTLSVGERDASGNFVGRGYDGKFTFKIKGNDEFIRPTLEQGWLFNKHITVALWPFLALQQQLDASQPAPLEGAKKPKQTVIEVGANMGYSAIPLARCLSDLGYSPADGRVLAFEAQKPLSELLHENVQLNEIQNLEIHSTFPGAINGLVHYSNKISSGSSKGLLLSDLLSQSPSSSLINYGGIQLGENGEEIQMITLDSLLSSAAASTASTASDSTVDSSTPNPSSSPLSSPIENISILKIDAEGAERLVLYGAQELLKKHYPIIVCNLNHRPSEEMRRSLSNHHFPSEAWSFDLFDYCSSLGYTKYIQLPRHYGLFIHPYRDIPNNHQEWLELFIPMTREQMNYSHIPVNSLLKCYGYSKPLWTQNGELIKTGKTQRELLKAEKSLKRVRETEERMIAEYENYIQEQQYTATMDFMDSMMDPMMATAAMAASGFPMEGFPFPMPPMDFPIDTENLEESDEQPRRKQRRR